MPFNKKSISKLNLLQLDTKNRYFLAKNNPSTIWICKHPVILFLSIIRKFVVNIYHPKLT